MPFGAFGFWSFVLKIFHLCSYQHNIKDSALRFIQTASLFLQFNDERFTYKGVDLIIRVALEIKLRGQRLKPARRNRIVNVRRTIIVLLNTVAASAQAIPPRNNSLVKVASLLVRLDAAATEVCGSVVVVLSFVVSMPYIHNCACDGLAVRIENLP